MFLGFFVIFLGSWVSRLPEEKVVDAILNMSVVRGQAALPSGPFGF
ncbi:hypothetical protein ACFPES_17135 [Paenibacillus sp. GCM10023248]|nr:MULTISPECIES: hypothetical protein [Bacillales]MDD9268767.1 hypothetical protein [Paenibacillus sp. MAHUQ-63]MDR6882154.1 hypothetical protein [Bacillus sp. 3255]